MYRNLDLDDTGYTEQEPSGQGQLCRVNGKPREQDLDWNPSVGRHPTDALKRFVNGTV